MNKNQKQLVLALLASGVLSAQAGTVVGMNISDTINTDTNGAAAGAPDGLGADGKSGAFRFSTSVNLDTYSGASLWHGDRNGGVINLSGSLPGQFSSGFIFAGASMLPFNGVLDRDTFLPVGMPIWGALSAAADASPVGTVLAGTELMLHISGWAADQPGYGGFGTFNLAPDPGTLVVDNLIKTSQAGGIAPYAYRLHFSHYITETDDPSYTFAGLTFNWVLEGTITAAVPEPESYALMLAGLGLVRAAARRRRAL